MYYGTSLTPESIKHYDSDIRIITSVTYVIAVDSIVWVSWRHHLLK